MLLPIRIEANHETKIEYQTYQGQVVFNTSGDLVETVKADFPPKPLPKAQISHYGGNCVYYVQNYLFGQIDLGWGVGGRNLPLTGQPVVGSVVIFTYPHVAVITAVVDGYLILSESNFIPGQITFGRQVSNTDPTIKGFYTP